MRLVRTLLVYLLVMVSAISCTQGRKRLIQQLEGTDAAVAIDAADRLGELEEQSAVPALIRVVEGTGYQDVRIAAAKALGAIGGPEATKALATAMLEEPAGGIGGACAEALGAAGGPEAREVLEKTMLTHLDGLGIACARALGEISDSESMEPLLRAASSWEGTEFASWAGSLVWCTAAIAADASGQSTPDFSGLIFRWGGHSQRWAAAVSLARLKGVEPEDVARLHAEQISEFRAYVEAGAKDAFEGPQRPDQLRLRRPVSDEVVKNCGGVLANLATDDSRKQFLDSLLKAATPEVLFACRVYPYLILLGRESDVAALKDAMGTCPTKDMAQDFLNSGNSELAGEARRWADEHGYITLPRLVTPGQTRWGSHAQRGGSR